MSRTEYVASKPTRVFPFPRTRLLGTSVARQSYNQAQPGPSTHSDHHVSQTSTHSVSATAFWRARASGAGVNASLGARALGGGDDSPAAAPCGAGPSF